VIDLNARLTEGGVSSSDARTAGQIIRTAAPAAACSHPPITADERSRTYHHRCGRALR